MAVKIKGGQTGSIKRLKSDLKKSSGGGTWIRYIPADDELSVRFLTEPDEWFKYDEHYDRDESVSFPCIGDDCPGCAMSDKRVNTSRKYLANVLDIENERVVPLKLPSTLANRLVSRFERYGTMMDRDYILIREGSKLNTSYDADSDPPSKRKLNKYELVDLEEALVEAFEEAFGDEDDDDRPRRTKGAKKKSGAKKGKRLRLPDDDTDDSDDTDDEDEEEAPPRRKKSTTSSSRRRRRR